MAGLKWLHSSGLAALGAYTAAAALQIPIFEPTTANQQLPLTADEAVTRPLIESEALQDTIKGENLLARAKELYQIAKLGEDEYNHPTRVIGSLG